MASVDGLASGLDTTSIISSLLSVDAAPQTRLKTSVTSAQAKVTALQSVNTKVAALQTAADNLAKVAGWSPSTATSSSDSVTVTAGATALPGALSFQVTALAAGRSVITDAGAPYTSSSDVKADLGFPLDVVKNGIIVGTVSPSTGSLTDVVDAINKATDLGITAVAVRVGENQYRLQITSTTTGDGKGDFSFAPAGSGTKGQAPTGNPADPTVAKLTNVSAARDATITVASNLNVPVTVKSSTNTFSEIMPGVTMSVSKVSTDPVTLAVAQDPKGVAKAVQSMVDAANAVLTEIQNQTKAGTVSSTGAVTGGGTLRGDSNLRALKGKVMEAVTGALADGSSPATFGLQSTKDGTLTFDQDKFLTALAKDPTGVRTQLAPSSYDTVGNKTSATGVVERLSTLAKDATKPFTGTLTQALTGQKDTISDLQDRISDWDTRLAAKQTAYQKYYANLETSLNSLKTQSTWLTGQLAAL